MTGNVYGEIEDALRRGNSPYTMDDIWRWHREHKLTLLIGGKMSASFMPHEGAMEIVHVGGRWNMSDVRWMLRRYRSAAALAGLELRYRGRKGWARFLRMKGIELCQ